MEADDYIPLGVIGGIALTALAGFTYAHIEQMAEAELDAKAPIVETCIKHPATRSKVSAE